MTTIIIQCQVQVDVQGNPSNEAIDIIVEKLNAHLKDSDLTCKPIIIAETAVLHSVVSKVEDAKKWYRSLTAEDQQALLDRSPYSGDEDFFNWLVQEREADICIHKHCVCSNN